MKYYCIKQHDMTDCGAACLATICKQNGYKIDITRIREVAGNVRDAISGATLTIMIDTICYDHILYIKYGKFLCAGSILQV